jgi:type I restriction enzyme M protein
LKDEGMEDSANLPDPDIIIVDIIEDIRTALEQLEEIAGDVAVAD